MIQSKIKKILDNHDLLRMATISTDGFPKVRSVDFARDKEDESKIYFLTFKTTDKVEELAANPHVHIVVDQPAHSMVELSQVLYLKASGKASLLEQPELIQKAMGHIITKYPYLADLPGDPSMMNVYQIQLQSVKVTDNAAGFGHTDSFEY